MMKVLSLLPVLGHPRDSKRIVMLQTEGIYVEVAAFERDYHKGRLPDCKVNTIGRVSHGKYVKRILTMIKSLSKVRDLIRDFDVIYCSGPDMAYLAVIASIGIDKPIVMEVGDIREIQVERTIKGKIYRVIDRYLTNRCSLLVATSEAFIKEYYYKWIGMNIKSLVIENKVEFSLDRNCIEYDNYSFNEVEFTNIRPLRIGYFGLLRDRWSLEILESLVQSNEIHVEVLLAGIPMESTKEVLNNLVKHESVCYFGEYKSPLDLPKLYNSVDMVWACYPKIEEGDWNLKWARPNRFYESCFFGTPIFSRYGCQDAFEVKKYNIGFVINEVESHLIIDKLSKITTSVFVQWKRNMSNLPQNVYQYSNEAKELAYEIGKLIKKI